MKQAWVGDGDDPAAELPPLLVILDLDGTLLDSERIVQKVVKGCVERRGGTYTLEAAKAGVGMRPAEATTALLKALGGLNGADENEVQLVRDLGTPTNDE